MSGTKSGGLLTRDTNYARYGRNYYVRLGAIGGKNGHTGGFYANRELASAAGKIGGLTSRRGKSKTTDKQRREIRKAYDHLLAVHTKVKRQREEDTHDTPRIDADAITVFDRKRGLVRSDRV